MAEYKNEEPCEFIYHVTAIEKVVDGDTIDAVIDLGFDVRYAGRVRLLGIDTPESRTRNLEEKFYGLLSKDALKSWVHWAVVSDRDDIAIKMMFNPVIWRIDNFSRNETELNIRNLIKHADQNN